MALFILTLAIFYDLLEAFMINKEGFIVLLIFSFSPIIINAIHEINSKKLVKRMESLKKEKITSIFDGYNLNYLMSWYIVVSIVQIILLWTPNVLIDS